MLPLNLRFFFEKNAKFTKKKLSHPNYCYLSFKALDIGAQRVLNFEIISMNKKVTASQIKVFFSFFLSYLQNYQGGFLVLQGEKKFDLYGNELQHTQY